MKKYIIGFVCGVLVSIPIIAYGSVGFGGDVHTYVDGETGVNYLIYEDWDMHGITASICPRYNTNGTLYVSGD